MKKPIVKALACAMALTMALSSPISALATEGISNIFSAGNSDDPKKSATSSVTNTDTGVIDVEESKDEYKQVVGIEIDPSSAILSTKNAGKEKVKFTPTIIFDNDAKDTEAFSLAELSEMSDQIFVFDGVEYYGIDEFQKALYNNLTWVYGKWDENTKEFDKSSADQSKNRVKLAFGDDGTATVELWNDVDKRTEKEANPTQWWQRPAYITVRLGTKYKSTATINFKKQITNLEVQEPDWSYVKHVIDLDAECIKGGKDSLDGNEDIIWDVYEKKDGQFKKTTYATISNGKMTLKKVTKKQPILYLRATTESGKTFELKEPFAILAGQPVNKISKSEVPKQIDIKWISEDNEKAEGTYKASYSVKMAADGEVKAGHITTDRNTTDEFTWNSKNEKIAKVTDLRAKSGNIEVDVEGYEIGKTTITITATSGKKITFNVVVKAPLEAITGVRLADSNKKTKDYVYCSQKVQLEAITRPSKTTDKIKWKIEAVGGDKTQTKDMKKLASLNGKGLLTAKKTENKTVRVVAYGKNKDGNDVEGEKTFTIKISPLTDITGMDKLIPSGKNKFALSLPLRRLKNIEIDPINQCTWTIEDKKEKTEILPELLTWTSSKPKVVEVDQNGQIRAIAAGKANVKVSFANSQKKLITKTIAVTVKQPVKAIALKQTDFTVNVGTKKNISLKVSQITPKGGKVDNYTWTTEVFDENGKSISTPTGITLPSAAASKKNSATVKFDKNVPNGTVVKVTVETNSGAKAYATITVCNKTTKFKSKVAKSDIYEVGKEYKVEELLTFETAGSDTKYNEKIVSCVPNNDNVRVEKVDGVWTVRVVKVGTGSTKLTVKTGSKSTSVTLKLGLGSGSSN